MKFIIRLFPEISIKSKPVRNRLIRQVRQNLVNVCKHHGISVNAYAQWDKVVAIFDETITKDRAITELSRIPGIHSFMEVNEYPFTTLDSLFDEIKDVVGPSIENKTFAVRVKRKGQHEFNSQMAERVIGGKFKASFPNKGVCLDNPEVLIHIEIENQTAYLSGEKHLGIGGYPVGSQGEVFSLISGGFDSGVSTYDVLHRGCRVNYLFFNMGGTAHEIGVKQESYFLWDRFASSHRVRFVTIPFEPIVGQILERTHHGVRGVILKRMMMRVGSLVAKKFDAEALVTGESLGQVSSQTLRNLTHIDNVCDVLLLRPLVTADKQDIIDKSREIGTIGFAESMPEYCGVISDHPNVCPSASFVEEEEAKMDSDLVQKAFESMKVVDINDIPKDTTKLKTEVETVSELLSNEVVLDVRAPDDVEKAPLTVEGHEVITMPFYKTASDFHTLDQIKTYALYCDQGVMSLMQAKQLKEKGYHNVKVYRPSK
ncbi:MAG: tRNA uracil 4-sulfurtransferase ThiI [Succinivibrio sp.]|nr:tRNA uracil 4-sulfurtransferase ThiI [Succinivibrio sp.]MDY5324079.1 tRNA uracil 4-sulfurtransferase ThiI [Succinivibrio sp.]MDY5733568.1 tRNA uracil 4-sulfurtransferase ThiI [Succinivibrio sp.]MDY5903484.1 tRNA uracil 4-sulfurtransferase ThiI [Succinivibrio sp.]